MIGAAVEAESASYIAKTFRSVDDILATRSVAEFTGPDWQVGRFTDDTQMMLCVAEWLIEDSAADAEGLLARFAEAYEPWRRYGPGTKTILRLYPQHKSNWRELSTVAFPEGSLGNGSAMHAAGSDSRIARRERCSTTTRRRYAGRCATGSGRTATGVATRCQ